jgi:hypothetical protein
VLDLPVKLITLNVSLRPSMRLTRSSKPGERFRTRCSVIAYSAYLVHPLAYVIDKVKAATEASTSYDSGSDVDYNSLTVPNDTLALGKALCMLFE